MKSINDTDTTKKTEAKTIYYMNIYVYKYVLKVLLIGVYAFIFSFINNIIVIIKLQICMYIVNCLKLFFNAKGK